MSDREGRVQADGRTMGGTTMVTQRTVSRTLIATAMSIFLSFVLTSPIAALTWETLVPLTGTTAAGWRNALAPTGATSAVAVYRVKDPGDVGIWVRRTTDAGDSWRPAVRISTIGTSAATRASVAADGQAVDAVWSEGGDCFYGPCALRYARSTDGGRTFAASRRLSPAGGLAGQAFVARSGARVVVAWTDAASGRLLVRVSSNGGKTFRPSVKLGISSNAYYPNAGKDAFPAAAFSGKVILVTYFSSAKVLKLRRSLDGGAKWTAAAKLSTNATASTTPTMAARGSGAVIAYGRSSAGVEWIAFRRTTDYGATWKPAGVLSPSATLPARSPVLSWNGGTVRGVFFRCLDSACAASTGGSGAAYVRTSTTGGASWSAPGQVSPVDPAAWADPVGVSALDGTLVLYVLLDTTTFDSTLFSRHAS